MSVNLKRLPEDEERVRLIRQVRHAADGDSIQNVLDALNYYRCLALHNQGELDRAKAGKPIVAAETTNERV